MIKVKFEKITYKNILSVGNKPIEIDLSTYDKTLMMGKNGQGKSLLADALTFALYGKAFRKIKKDQIINAINKKNLLVELELTVGKTKYKIIRGIKPNKFEIWINGKKRDQEANVKDTQSFLEQNILGMNEKTFRQIVILGSTSFVPFMKLSAADRRAVVENLLDIQVFSYMQQVVKGRASNLKNSYRDIASKLDILNTTLELKERHIDDLKNRDENKKKENLKKITEYDTMIKSIRKTISKLNDDLAIQIKEIPNVDDLQDKLSSLKVYKSQIQTNIKSYNSDISFYQDNAVCPTCRQDISEKIKTKVVTEKKSDLEKAQEGLAKLENEIDLSVKRISEINKQLESIKKIENEISDNEYEIKTNEKIIENLKLNNKTDTDTASTIEAEKEVDALKVDISELSSVKNDIIKEGNYYGVVMDMIKDGGIKTKIIKNYIPVINTIIRKYLKILDFPINFTFDEEFNETIKARNRDIFSYANFSEGEKLRIDLSLLFTWREVARMKNSASCNLILFDEIGGNSLDSDGVDAFMRIISGEKDQNIFVISHNQSMVDRFTQILTFEKVGNFTTVKNS